MTNAAAFDALVNAVLGEVKHALHAVDERELDRLQAMIRDARRIFVAGKGRSGLQMSGFAMRLMHLGLAVHVVGDVTTPATGPGDLLIIGSGSGRTPSLVGYAERVQAVGAQLALITTAAESPIGTHAACIVRLEAPTPKLPEQYDSAASVQPMGSVFEQALGLLLDIVIVRLAAELHTDGDHMFARHANLE